MKQITFVGILIAALSSLAASALAQGKPAGPLAAVKMVVTVEGDRDKRPPELKREDVVLTLGKERLQVTGWTPATGENAGLAFFVVVDDACDSSLGGLLDDVRAFIQTQPA